MALRRQQNLTKDSIGYINYSIQDPGPNVEGGVEHAEFMVHVLQSDGSTLPIPAFDLFATLREDATGQTHAANIRAAMAYIRARANAEVLPT